MEDDELQVVTGTFVAAASKILKDRCRSSDKLGRYYTKSDVGAALVAHMAGLSPVRLLDLGSGAGSLSFAALSQWKDVRLLTVDIDTCSPQKLSKVLPPGGKHRHNHLHADALCSDLPQLISTRLRRIDTGVCNPPFTTPRWRKSFGHILEDAGFSNSLPVLRDVSAALLFLAQNLRVLSEDATLGIILPDTLISGSHYREFRKQLLQRYCLKKVVCLPRGSFERTDALAHIVVVSKGKSTEGKIRLQQLQSDAHSVPPVCIDAEQGVARLDYLYHSQNRVRSANRKGAVRLGDVCFDLSRGLYTAAEARLIGANAIHTTDLNDAWTGSWRKFARSNGVRRVSRKHVEVEPGDILMARVGRNLQYKIVGVRIGGAPITDCIYRIRVGKLWRNKVLKQLASPSGRAWIESRTCGVGARTISKFELLEFPLRKGR